MPTELVAADHLLFNAEDVRTELRKVRDQLQRDKDQHVRAWVQSKEGHKAEICIPCKLWDARMQGVDRVIRHFGGRIRRG